MKHLRKFNETKEGDVLATLRDIGMELEDDGLKIKFHFYKEIDGYIGGNDFVCKILKPEEIKYYKLNDNIVDTILRMIDYMKGMSYEVSDLYITSHEGMKHITLWELKNTKRKPFIEIIMVFEEQEVN